MQGSFVGDIAQYLPQKSPAFLQKRLASSAKVTYVFRKKWRACCLVDSDDIAAQDV